MMLSAVVRPCERFRRRLTSCWADTAECSSFPVALIKEASEAYSTDHTVDATTAHSSYTCATAAPTLSCNSTLQHSGRCKSHFCEVCEWHPLMLHSCTLSLLLRTDQQYLSCALGRGRGVVLRVYHQSIAKRAGTDFRDGAVVPFE